MGRGTHLLLLLALPLAASLSGCGFGTYQSEKEPIHRLFPGGYFEEAGPGQLIKVGFHPTIGVKLYESGIFTLYRCAEVAQREGKPYFALYQDLPAAIQDRRSDKPAPSAVLGKAFAYAYIQLFDAPATGLLSTSEVLARLGPEIKGQAR